MTPGRNVHARKALTLLEVIISITLIILLLAFVLGFFWQMLEIRNVAAARAERTNLARQVLTRIETELRGCIGTEQVRFPVEQRFAGDRRTLTFLTTSLPAEHQYEFFDDLATPPPAQHDLTLVSYRLWISEDERDEFGEPVVGGIIRTEKKTLNQFLVDEEDPLQVRNDLWSAELGYLEFRYYDGVEWTTTWDATQGNSLPQAVQVTVGYGSVTQDEIDDRDLDEFPILDYPFGDDLSHNDRYSLVVRLPAADKFFSSRLERVSNQMTEQFGVDGGP